MLGPIYHITLKLLGNCIFDIKMFRFWHYVHNIVIDIIK